MIPPSVGCAVDSVSWTGTVSRLSWYSGFSFCTVMFIFGASVGGASISILRRPMCIVRLPSDVVTGCAILVAVLIWENSCNKRQCIIHQTYDMALISCNERQCVIHYTYDMAIIYDSDKFYIVKSLKVRDRICNTWNDSLSRIVWEQWNPS